MITIKYYTHDNKYRGWRKYCNDNYLELNSWLASDSGYVIINGIKYTNN